MAIGLPSLLRKSTAALNTGALLAADGLLVIHQFFNTERWGLYLKDKLVIEADSVKSIDYRKASRVSDYPQEEGAFQSYNKVSSPFESRVELTKGGSQRDRAAFLDAIEKAAASLDIYDLAMPEKTYTGVNIEGYEFRRSADAGLGLITVELSLVQVRQTATTAFRNTSQPSGATVQDVGTVRPETPTDAVINAVGPAISYPVKDLSVITSVGLR